MTLNDFQGGYADKSPVGYPGMIATTNARDAFTHTIETSAAGFGLAMGQGAADRGAVLGGAAFIGLTIADKSRDSEAYGIGETASLLRKGTMVVTASTAVNAGDAVTYDANGALGAGLANTIPGARFESTAQAGSLVRIYLG